jgi:hypothetical protein
MTDVAYQCHNCGSLHEVELIRENLILDLRTAASYELSGQRGMLGPRARFLRWRMTRGLARALWPGYPHHPPLPGASGCCLGSLRLCLIARSGAGQQLAAPVGGQVIRLEPVPVTGWPAPDPPEPSPRRSIQGQEGHPTTTRQVRLGWRSRRRHGKDGAWPHGRCSSAWPALIPGSYGWPVGARKAATSFSMASTPVSALQPAAKAFSSSQSPGTSVAAGQQTVAAAAPCAPRSCSASSCQHAAGPGVPHRSTSWPARCAGTAT